MRDYGSDIIATQNIKFTNKEIELLINSLQYLLSVNLPIDEDFLHPYARLKDDLSKIQDNINEKIREAQSDKKEIKTEEALRQGTPSCETCE